MTSEDKIEELSWDDITLATEHIAGHFIHSEDFMPDTIIGISRGGLIPAVMVAHLLGIRKVSSWQLESYTGDRIQKGVTSLDHLPTLQPSSKVLFVDDICDTGATIAHIRSRCNVLGISRTRYKIATAVLKDYSAGMVDWPNVYFSRYSDPCWVKFPWEVT